MLKQFYRDNFQIVNKLHTWENTMSKRMKSQKISLPNMRTTKVRSLEKPD